MTKQYLVVIGWDYDLLIAAEKFEDSLNLGLREGWLLIGSISLASIPGEEPWERAKVVYSALMERVML